MSMGITQARASEVMARIFAQVGKQARFIQQMTVVCALVWAVIVAAQEREPIAQS